MISLFSAPPPSLPWKHQPPAGWGDRNSSAVALQQGYDPPPPVPTRLPWAATRVAWWRDPRGSARPCASNTPLWPQIGLNGRSGRPILINRLVMPCPRPSDIPFFGTFSKLQYHLLHIVIHTFTYYIYFFYHTTTLVSNVIQPLRIFLSLTRVR